MDTPVPGAYTDVARPPPGNRRVSDTLPEHISRERRSRLLLLGFDHVARCSTFDPLILDDLVTALGGYEANNKLRCALLFAYGRHLTAGLDLANVGEIPRQDWRLPEGVVDPQDTFDGRCSSKPLVVAAQDYCYTIGVGLILAADINLCVSSACSAQLGVQCGILLFGGATLRMYQIAGWGSAVRWLLTGSESDAHEAYRLGLIQEITAPEDLLDHVTVLVERVMVQTPLGVCATLGSVRQALLEGEAITAVALPETARRLLGSEDVREGLRALREHRLGRSEER